MRTLLFLVLMTIVVSVKGQVESGANSVRPWYSAYVNKKINHRWSVDAFGLLAMRSMNQDFWLTQVNLGANYRVNRFWTASFGYGHARYKHTGAWWDRHYPDLEPGVFNTVAFHSLNLGLRRDDQIGRNWTISNRFIYQKYFPRFEKYGTRLQYGLRLSYRRGNLPKRLKPFIQGALYYYLDGVPVDYYDEAFEVIENAPPNGLHRMRFRFGARFRPITSNRQLSLVVYYGYNREFNGSGNDLNFLRPSSSGNRTFTTYPFNNYSIVGLQVNYFLK